VKNLRAEVRRLQGREEEVAGRDGLDRAIEIEVEYQI